MWAAQKEQCQGDLGKSGCINGCDLNFSYNYNTYLMDQFQNQSGWRKAVFMSAGIF